MPDDQLAAAADGWAARIAGNAPLWSCDELNIQRVMSKAFDIDHKDIDELDARSAPATMRRRASARSSAQTGVERRMTHCWPLQREARSFKMEV
jgi:hypothetical protein